MLLGILADTHDELDRTRRAIDLRLPHEVAFREVKAKQAELWKV